MQFIAEMASNSYLALRQQFNTSDLPLFWLDRANRNCSSAIDAVSLNRIGLFKQLSYLLCTAVSA